MLPTILTNRKLDGCYTLKSMNSEREEIFESTGASGDGQDQIDAYRDSFKAKYDQPGHLLTQSINVDSSMSFFKNTNMTEFSIAGSAAERRVESPIQRLSRLKMELAELQVDLDSVVKVRLLLTLSKRNDR